jgi:hypothetical protein
MAFQQVLNRFEGLRKLADRRWMALCPCHQDRRPSLSIGIGVKGVVLKCFAGCLVSDVLQTVGLEMKDLFLSPGSASGARLPEHDGISPDVVATFGYRDESGRLLYEVLRRSGKRFSQRRPDPLRPGKWIWDLKNVRRVLYGLPELLAADSGTVYVAEGEKDVHTLRNNGFLATTNSGGAAASSLWKDKRFAAPLRGRNIVILPDNDRPGREHAVAVAEGLRSVAASVRLLELPGLPEKGDVTDWFAQGGSEDELRRLAGLAPPSRGHETVPSEGSTDAGESKERLSQVHRIVELAQAVIQLFKTPEDEAFATLQRRGHHETRSLGSSAFRHFVIELFFRTEGRIPSGAAVTDAIGTLVALAMMGDVTRPVALRVSSRGDSCLIDLVAGSWQLVEITPEDWSLIGSDAGPVCFRRQRAMLPLPVPERGGDLTELRPFLNPGSEENWRLMLAWLTFALQPQGPFPVLVVQGEQGSAKSTTSRILRALIDPSISELRMLPKDPQDLMVAAKNSWVLAYDNLSGMPNWLSDGLCSLSTGSAYTTRALYTADEETVIRATRPVIVNGIDDMTTRPDLADRAVVLSLPTIAPEQRREEREFWSTFESSKPRILGALYSAMSAGLRSRLSIRLTCRPRMADFAAWGVALEHALGWPPGAFLDAYQRNLSESSIAALDADSVAMAVLTLMNEGGSGWEGTVGALLAELEQRVSPERRGKSWPRSPQSLTNRMRRAAPALRREGLDLRQPPRSRQGALWSIRRLRQEPERSSRSSSSPNGQKFREVEPDPVSDDVICEDHELAVAVTKEDEGSSRHEKFVTFESLRPTVPRVEDVDGDETCCLSGAKEAEESLVRSPVVSSSAKRLATSSTVDGTGG